jgi:hypothetical protein
MFGAAARTGNPAGISIVTAMIRTDSIERIFERNIVSPYFVCRLVCRWSSAARQNLHTLEQALKK